MNWNSHLQSSIKFVIRETYLQIVAIGQPGFQKPPGYLCCKQNAVTLNVYKMETKEKTVITVENTISALVEKVWDYWTKPEHITKWSNASDDWHTPWAKNDLRVGGNFVSRMEAKDGSTGFDFGGVYDVVKFLEYIEYSIDDGRKVKVRFTPGGNITKVVENFEAENTHSVEMQKGGWQAILDNFKKYTE